MDKETLLEINGHDWKILRCELSRSAEANPLFAADDRDPDDILEEQMRLMEAEFEALAEDPDKPLAGTDPPVHVALDTEYQHNAEGDRLDVLSYQFFLVSLWGIMAGIVYPKRSGKHGRLKFESFVGIIIGEARRRKVVRMWPKMVMVYAHFLRADLPNFGDFESFSDQLDCIQGTLASVGGDLVVHSDYDADVGPRPNGRMVLRDRQRRLRLTQVRFIDTLLLTPGRAGLAVTGEMIGLPKLELPESYDKSEMRKFLREQPEAFEAYALRDAEIAVMYGLKMQRFVRDELGMRRLPPTLGALAARLCRQLLDVDDGGFERAFGIERGHRKTYWNERQGRKIVMNATGPTAFRERHENFVTKCYHGGRNESFALGPTAISDWHDFDLKSAYTASMVDILTPDYAAAYDSKDPLAFVGHVCGFAWVDFEFPEGVRFPCLPVRVEDRGLYFPRRGRTYCTAPELALALDLGCAIDIQIGLIVPWAPDGARVFEPFVRRVRERRLHFKALGQLLEEKLWKEIGNSAYGKTAQGLREKSVFDARTRKGKMLPPSPLTNPYFAAHITGLVRAVVSEIMARIPPHRTVVSVTTDGFLTDADLDELDLTGPMAVRFQALLDRVDGAAAGGADHA
ncbi:DNA polymerase type B [Methylomagnum ishizawai]|uniref:DNA polymerase type B n=1 Tax=Methylomagnum ishizawai TaxID=1760988 RepID=A0A1Y6D480_9GAMM|nr:hypothetical protein [Methylomagnum ishizawai]SMF97230.1 DNA polymerase type B [Methylomagnum ishizawai]